MGVLNCGVLGAGNAGGQIANIASKFKFDAVALNVSKSDLDLLDSVKTIAIGDQLGSGKDRNIAKTFFKGVAREFIENDTIVEFVKNNHVIFVSNSTGGGSGSAIGPILTNLLESKYGRLNNKLTENERKIFINIGVFPTLSDSVDSQKNSLDYMKEILSYDARYMLYDNEKVTNLSTKEMMLAVNNRIVDDLCVIRGDYNILSQYGMIDGKDMMKIIGGVPGMIHVSRALNFSENTLVDSSIEDILINDTVKGVGCDIERDRIVKRLGQIVNIQKDIAKYYNKALGKFKEYVGEPVCNFDHYYEIAEDENFKNAVYAIASGLSAPDERMKRMLTKITESEENLKRVKKSSVLSEYTGGDYISELNKKDEIGDKVDDVDDILNKF